MRARGCVLIGMQRERASALLSLALPGLKPVRERAHGRCGSPAWDPWPASSLLAPRPPQVDEPALISRRVLIVIVIITTTITMDDDASASPPSPSRSCIVQLAPDEMSRYEARQAQPPHSDCDTPLRHAARADQTPRRTEPSVLAPRENLPSSSVESLRGGH